jgi:hypothetical protein
MKQLLKPVLAICIGALMLCAASAQLQFNPPGHKELQPLTDQKTILENTIGVVNRRDFSLVAKLANAHDGVTLDKFARQGRIFYITKGVKVYVFHADGDVEQVTLVSNGLTVWVLADKVSAY